MISTKKLRRKLRRIPRYASILSERCGTSTMTIYRVLRGESSPQTYEILKKAQVLVSEYDARIAALTKSINHENRNRN